MPHFSVRIRQRHLLLLLFLLGLLLCVLFLRQTQGLGVGEMQTDSAALSDWLTGGKDAPFYFWYLLWSRSWLPALWIGLSFTGVGALVLYFSWIYLGFSLGILLWTVVLYAGWRCPFLLWGLLFPQYLCYIPALLLLYIGCLRWGRFWREHHRYTRGFPWKHPQLRIFVLRMVLGILLYGAGIWCEYRINPWVLTKIFIKP